MTKYPKITLLVNGIIMVYIVDHHNKMENTTTTLTVQIQTTHLFLSPGMTTLHNSLVVS